MELHFEFARTENEVLLCLPGEERLRRNGVEVELELANQAGNGTQTMGVRGVDPLPIVSFWELRPSWSWLLPGAPFLGELTAHYWG